MKFATLKDGTLTLSRIAVPIAGGELKGFPETKRTGKSGSEPKSDDSPEQLPRGLRNPFGP